MINFGKHQKWLALYLATFSALSWAALPHAMPSGSAQNTARRPNVVSTPTFYREILPILQTHCQICHRAEGIAPMRFESYEQTRPYAPAIKLATQNRSMPPWFADPRIGHFSNDPSLSPGQIAALASWADAGAPAGDPRDAPPPVHWAESWSIPHPDLILKMPKGVALPASGDVEYTYEIVPTGFKEDRWISAIEILPALRANVHHAVVYVRPPDSKWMQHAPVGVPFTATTLSDAEDRRGAHWTDSDVLLVTRRGVLRTIGKAAWGNISQRARTSFFRCITQPTGMRAAIKPAWG